jgi:hypothetical protein
MITPFYKPLLDQSFHQQHNLSLCKRCVLPITPTNQLTASGCTGCSQGQATFENLLQTCDNKQLDNLLNSFKSSKRKRLCGYDCVLGVSGGVDSSWLAVKIVQLGLRPYLVHVDNGWNTATSSNNIFKLVKYLSLPLHTTVLSWDVFRDLQLAHLSAGVIDIEVCSDHAIFAQMFRASLAHHSIPILHGINASSENTMHPGIIHNKHDALQLRSIYYRYSRRRLDSYPLFSNLDYLIAKFINGVRWIPALNYFEYDKELAANELSSLYGFTKPERKHEESLLTKIYQRVILPLKFQVDKRAGHYSSLIVSGQLSRDDALSLISKPIYASPIELANDIYTFANYLEISTHHFTSYLKSAGYSHASYPSELPILTKLLTIKRKLFC